MNTFPATTPKPPYYAVVFAANRSDEDETGYAAMAQQMMQLASEQPGYLGVESVRNDAGHGLTVSYWKDLASIQNWREVAEHKTAQQLGRSKWYTRFRLRVCRVECDALFDRDLAE